MFAAIKLDLQERGGKIQRTDVVRVDAEVLDVASEAERQIVSVRFHGLIREDEMASPSPSTRSRASSSRPTQPRGGDRGDPADDGCARLRPRSRPARRTLGAR